MSPPHFLYDFSRKIFLMLYCINWLGNICIAIICFLFYYMTKKSKQKELLRWNKRRFSLFLKGCLPKIVSDLKVRPWNRKLVLSSSENVRKNIPFQMFYHADDIASSVLFTNRKPQILLVKLLGCFKQLEPGDFQRFVSITKQALMVLSSSSTGI